MAWPITINEAKAHSYITSTDEDAQIYSMISAACEEFEQLTNIMLVQAQTTEAFESWPANGSLILPRWPLVSVASIAYTDSDGDANTLSSDEYWVDTLSSPGRIWLHRNSWWPTATLRPGPSIVATYTAGYADAGAVPDVIKRVLLVMFADLYEHRETTIAAPGVTVNTLQFVRNQIANWRRYPA